MGECIDVEAREDIGKIKTYIQQIASALWGDDRLRDNGVRSEVRDHGPKIESLMKWRDHYLDSERSETCLGLAALAARDQAMQTKAAEEIPVKVARIQAGSANWAQILTLIGVLFVAVISLLKDIL